MGSKKEDILFMMEDVYSVYNTKEHYLNTNNGILNKENLNYTKKRFLKDSVSYLTEELVKTKQHYPKDDISQVDIKTDFVVMDANTYNTIKEYIENE